MMAGTRRRRRRSGISQADPAEQVALLSQRGLVRAREIGRDEPVRVATPVGTLDEGTLAYVDPAGLVQLDGRDWSLDWWVGAEDRWHFASSDPTVAQTLVGSTPVIRTSMHVPGGEIIQRVFGARASARGDSGTWAGGAVVIEIENQSAVPVALALVARPLTLWGGGSIRELGSDGPVISVDGSTAAILSRSVLRRVVGPPGTTAIRLDLEDDEQPDGTWSVEGQMAEGAFVVPLPHTAVVRVLLPAGVAGMPARREARSTASALKWGGEVDWDAPEAEQVKGGWQAITRKMVSVSSPEPLLDLLVSASQGFLTLVDHPSFGETVGGYSAAFRNAVLSEALVTCSADEAVEPLARALVEAERLRGGIRMDDRSDASIALLHCAAPLLTGARSQYWSEVLLGAVAKAVHRVGRGKGLGPREHGDDPMVEAELRASAATAMARLSPALMHIDQPEVATASHEIYHQLAGHSRPEHHHEQGGHNHSAVPVPETGPMPATPPDFSEVTLRRGLVVRTMIRNRIPGAATALVGFARLGHLGLLPAALDGNDVPHGPHAIDPAATALRLSALTDVFVTDAPASIEILPCWEPTWFEKQIEVENVRTRLGTVSFALRWHGNRPVLLWEVEPGTGVDESLVEPIITAPVLDSNWHGHGWRGEAMLAVVNISQEAREVIAQRNKPRKAVKLGLKKPAGGN